ncbi:MAG: ankyrin repeat domain-containing protein, partial [Armatimonadetes bacterium]|nr:ankyrin repeat domain-containing protein [Candidatus Hippobium faecium]
IHICLNNYNSDLFRYILQNEKGINKKSNNGTPLEIAIDHSNYEAVRLLVENKADINQKGLGYPLIEAFYMHNDDILKLLIDSNPNINVADDEGITPLMLAVKYCDYETVSRILDMGAESETQSKEKYTALHLSVFNNTEDRLKIFSLMANKAKDVNIKSEIGITPMYNACGMNEIKMAELLKSKGGDPKIPNKMQLDALELARDRGYTEILSLFGSKIPESEDNFDNCNYKFVLLNLPEKYLTDIQQILEQRLINSRINTMTYTDKNLIIELSTSMVIGEVTPLFTKTETKEFKFERKGTKDKTVDLCCEFTKK